MIWHMMNARNDLADRSSEQIGLSFVSGRLPATWEAIPDSDAGDCKGLLASGGKNGPHKLCFFFNAVNILM